MEIGTGYVNVFVSDFDRSLVFYRDTLHLPLIFADEEYQYASFATPGAQLAIMHTLEPELIGRHTGVGLTVTNLDDAYRELHEQVEFAVKPEKQPWGGYMAIISDPDKNLFYLDQFVNSDGELA